MKADELKRIKASQSGGECEGHDAEWMQADADMRADMRTIDVIWGDAEECKMVYSATKSIHNRYWNTQSKCQN